MAWRRNTFVSARHRGPHARGARAAAARDVRVKEFLYGPVAIQLSGKILDAKHRPNMPSSITSKRRTDQEQAFSGALFAMFRRGQLRSRATAPWSPRGSRLAFARASP